MGGEGHNYDGYGGLSSQDHRTDCGDYGKEGRRRGMGVGLGINYYRGNRSVENYRVQEEATVNNCRLCCREVDLQTIGS